MLAALLANIPFGQTKKHFDPTDPDEDVILATDILLSNRRPSFKITTRTSYSKGD